MEYLESKVYGFVMFVFSDWSYDALVEMWRGRGGSRNALSSIKNKKRSFWAPVVSIPIKNILDIMDDVDHDLPNTGDVGNIYLYV